MKTNYHLTWNNHHLSSMSLNNSPNGLGWQVFVIQHFGKHQERHMTLIVHVLSPGQPPVPSDGGSAMASLLFDFCQAKAKKTCQNANHNQSFGCIHRETLSKSRHFQQQLACLYDHLLAFAQHTLRNGKLKKTMSTIDIVLSLVCCFFLITSFRLALPVIEFTMFWHRRRVADEFLATIRKKSSRAVHAV